MNGTWTFQDICQGINWLHLGTPDWVEDCRNFSDPDDMELRSHVGTHPRFVDTY